MRQLLFVLACWMFLMKRKSWITQDTHGKSLIVWMKDNTVLSTLLKVQIRSWRKECSAVNPGGLDSLRCDGRGIKIVQVYMLMRWESDKTPKTGSTEKRCKCQERWLWWQKILGILAFYSSYLPFLFSSKLLIILFRFFCLTCVMSIQLSNT